MRTKTIVLAWMTAGLVVYGCTEKNEQIDGTAGDPGETLEMETDPFVPGDEGDAESGDEGETDPVDPSGVSFIPGDDIPDLAKECNVWTQDCNDGEKCMPWDNAGGSSWNATRCTPIHPNAAQPGDECTVEGSGVSGVDDCALGSMCWHVDPETNLGTCIAFCVGSELSYSCDDPNTQCSIFNDGVLILCLPSCDPLLQDCADGQGCYGAENGFVCIPDASGPAGDYGEPCEYVNVCSPGLFCASGGAVPGCQGSLGCCSEYCDMSQPNPASACSGAAGGQECVPWFEQGQAPPGYADVGACAIPQ